MIFTNWDRERKIRKVLRGLSRQRIAMILQPGNVQVVELAVMSNEETDAILRTCHIRGWIEPIANAVPKGSLTPNGELPPDGELSTHIGPIYRITSAGWDVINYKDTIIIFTLVVSISTFLVAGLTLAVMIINGVLPK